MTEIVAGTMAGAPVDLDAVVRDLRALSIRGLARMYLPDEGLFAFCLRRVGGQERLEGVSYRYTAITLLALCNETEEARQAVVGKESLDAICGRLLRRVGQTEDLGEVALTYWAARSLGHPDAVKALERLRYMQPAEGAYPTVEVAWSLTCLVASGGEVADRKLADAIAGRLKQSFHAGSALFAHWPTGSHPSWMRAHVACFADLVYPVQALSHYYRMTGDSAALDAARRCAAKMCALQGGAGQWWWHYDIRTGCVLERYPVYSVHQDAMGPMALFALQDACGTEHLDAVAQSLRWLIDPPEIDGALIDPRAEVIWRKVMRREPAKMVRRIQAAVSRVHPGLRMPVVDWFFPPTDVDWESRPYHLSWLLYAWPGSKTSYFRI